MTETICTLRRGYGMDLASYVDHIFKSEATAIAWRNRQHYNTVVVVLPGRRMLNERVEHGTPRESLESRYTTTS